MKFLLALNLVICCIATNAQKKNQYISVEILSDYDSYSFKSNFNTTQIEEGLQGNGIRSGLNFQYQTQVFKNWYFNFGAGYYNYKFSINRPFLYTGDFPNRPLYNTRKYIYNCISILVGTKYEKEVFKNLIWNIDLDYTYYYTLRQKYLLSINNSAEINKQLFHFGNSINISTSLLKKIDNLSFGFQICAPILEYWRKDKIFKENPFESNHKFLGGFGLGLICMYNLKK